MDQDKIDRTIEIILQNQAQFHADMQKLQEAQERSEKRINTLEKVSANLIEVAQATNSSVGNLTAKVDILVETQIETDERLNSVIFIVEKYLSNQNGKKNN